jgi:hypothetical protein
MHIRDVFFEHTVCVDVDPALLDAVEEKHVVNKAEDVLDEELGEAAKWFEHAATAGDEVTFELRVGTAHMADVSDEDARDRAEEWATEMFETVDAPVAVDDLEFVEVRDPEEDDSSDAVDDGSDDGSDTMASSEEDTVIDTDTVTDNGSGNTLVEAMGGDPA